MHKFYIISNCGWDWAFLKKGLFNSDFRVHNKRADPILP